MASPAQHGRDLVIYYNDCIDSDNLASALALVDVMKTRPATQVLWILEPRQVCLGLGMTNDESDECKRLIGTHFNKPVSPTKVLVGGLLSESEIEAVTDISDQERILLRKALKSGYGPKTDAMAHCRLVARDFITCVSKRTGAPVEAFLDIESLDELENPVNLNVHHHEELTSRSPKELEEYAAIIQEPMEKRLPGLRAWYARCTERAQKVCAEIIRDLNFEKLCGTIQRAGKVQFFGGSSCRILRQLDQKGLSSKIECNIQTGSCDLNQNLFPNQFNICLNRSAAEYVLENFTNFAKFRVVPSHTAQSIVYSTVGLWQFGGRCLETRVLGFNVREWPPKIVAGDVTLEKDYANKEYPMPDLTAFLCTLIPEELERFGGRLGFVKLRKQGETILFDQISEEEAQKVGSKAIPIYDIPEKKHLGKEEVVSLLNILGREIG
ncbi:hypothetical protein S40285_05740 [Stachybotrys chlorohalonatus IBT 40285]|uniref:Uncharacterized protein n=1 Tax=Stachybotrys chlorohalonatus (strain IBT 40285) TaxID=1283841 RepID=A0A084QSK3_STAC4|nr:hypothetical protein S40285_05740 [Stachybotrys chlorohalonata IBT 40285]